MIEISAAADKLLEELKGNGVKLSLPGEKLRVQGELSDELKKRVLKNKKGLIQLIKLGEHRWRKVEEWEFRREGNRMIGKRLDEAGEASWEVTPSNPLEERKVS